jgi:hypothetical protein
MRSFVGTLVAVAALTACASKEPTRVETSTRLGPPALAIVATSRVVSSAGGAPALEVTAKGWNPTTSHILLAVAPECPLVVWVFPDPTGAAMGSVDPSKGCASVGTTRDVAPGDTVVVTRTVGADAFASLPAGTYGVNVALTTSTAITGVWGGAVQLPLTNAP